jgi:Zn-dependent protease with chaperone function
MATDFYQRQDDARRSTMWLLGVFALGTAGVVAAVAAAAWALARANSPSYAMRSVDPAANWVDQAGQEAAFPLVAGGGTLLLILSGSAFKIAQLRGGGHVVAESLNGRRVSPDTTDPVERRLLNVVEEMALASGVPVPSVFLLADEPGINAFAAGYSPSDAVVGVTRGCAETLSRDELQGVVAHEFSHILNGDMRLNIRLIGVLYGILLLGLIGKILMRSTARGGRRSSNSKGGDATMWVLLMGLALIVIGSVGTIIGNLIKAAVSRQREYLADASAVQFTRNPEGLCGALKRIAAGASKLAAPNAAVASHMYFAQGVWEGLTKLTATHPPLRERILRLEPQWDGSLPVAAAPAAATDRGGRRSDRIAGLAGEEAGLATGAVGRGRRDTITPIAVVARAADQVGDPTERHRQYAAALIDALPASVKQSVREPYGARAVLYALLTDHREDVRRKQLARLQELATPDIFAVTLSLLPIVGELDVRARLPLVDMALPALRAMSPAQYREFLACFRELVRADNKLGLFEWTLYRVLLRHLRPQFERTAPPKAAFYGLQKKGPQCSVLLSALAHADNRRGEAPAALARGAQMLPNVAVRLLEPGECGLSELSAALDDLSRVVDKKRRHVVEACAACICADDEVTVAEAELLRGICDMLDCPMPPLLPGGPAESGLDDAA